ncbi:MAG TPA: D-Ala-D-Ala carboxypeptidase family metallohydrolase [Polyangiales bacterium]|nr:D-Ala-D-Ala carboxypeptidase family metallohydrolase [Polyangiales bacterium]
MIRQLSKHFTLQEFLHSQTAARVGIVQRLPDALWPNLQRLVDTILEPIRETLNTPIHVSSGYRDRVVNSLVGGAANSAHMDARAADITTSAWTAPELARLIQQMNLPGMHKCILEFGSWVHVSIAEDNETPLRQYMHAKRVHGRTIYEVGFGD